MILKINNSIACIIIASLTSAECGIHRQKRQDSPLIPDPITETNTTVETEPDQPSSTPDPENPCNIEISAMPPDYRKLGMSNSRISEIKCKEFMWAMEYRNALDETNKKCISYKNIHGCSNVMYAVGGRDTTPGEFPHMAAIGWKLTTGTWSFKCGGSLISDKFILTAAHCARISDRGDTVADYEPKIARLGDKNIADVWSRNSPPIDANITKIYVHPQYQSPKKYFDVALMELEEPITFTKYVQPACLWNNLNTSALGTEAILTGWGVVDTATLRVSPELQAANVDILDSKQCDELLQLCSRKWCGMQDNQLCAGKLSGGVDSCQGDSGGPLQVKIPLPITTQGTLSYIIGITSFGKGCALPNSPGVYARVSTVIDWIESIVWPENTRN